MRTICRQCQQFELDAIRLQLTLRFTDFLFESLVIFHDGQDCANRSETLCNMDELLQVHGSQTAPR